MNAYSSPYIGISFAGEPAERPAPQARAREADLFNLALRVASDVELDWLWLYMQLADPAHRRYCLQRVLAINPHSAIARRELELLEPTA